MEDIKQTSQIEIANNQTYSVDEIAKLLNISKRSAYDLIRNNQFAYKKIGRIIRVSKKSFDEWLNK